MSETTLDYHELARRGQEYYDRFLRAKLEPGRFIQIPGPNPILTPGPEGAWDDVGFSEAEVHSIIEPPFVYIYHTLRYRRPWRTRFQKQFPRVEDVGVQVLVMQRPFSLDMPLLRQASLAAGTTMPSSLRNSPAVALSHVPRAALTAECTYGKGSAKGLRLHVRSSPDGLRYDTVDVHTFDLDCLPGRTCRKTFTFDADVHIPRTRKAIRGKASRQSTGLEVTGPW